MKNYNMIIYYRLKKIGKKWIRYKKVNMLD